MNSENNLEQEVRSPIIRRVMYGGVVVFLILSYAAFSFVSRAHLPPNTFPLNTDIVILQGSTLNSIAEVLAVNGVIRSALYFKFIAIQSGSAEALHAGTYRFPEVLTADRVLSALRSGEYTESDLSITIPEGTRNTLIAELVAARVPTFDTQAFLLHASSSEGYLFPDTYHISPTVSPDELILRMKQTFDEKVRDAFGEASATITHDTVITASLLEREGDTPENMALIAGILENRRSVGMPLQVDATLEYERGKGSSELTRDDLLLDSPFNTYTRKGLPPAPISNPGITALRAALYPEKNDYLYYLTGNDGTFHFATTFEEHKRNKAKYLR